MKHRGIDRLPATAEIPVGPTGTERGIGRGIRCRTGQSRPDSEVLLLPRHVDRRGTPQGRGHRRRFVQGPRLGPEQRRRRLRDQHCRAGSHRSRPRVARRSPHPQGSGRQQDTPDAGRRVRLDVPDGRPRLGHRVTRGTSSPPSAGRCRPTSTACGSTISGTPAPVSASPPERTPN